MNKLTTRLSRRVPFLLLGIVTLIFFFGGTISVPEATSKALPAHVQVLLGFKERYGEDNKQHLGIDVYAEKGSELRSPVSGSISFVGRVPGSAGLNVMALTVTTAEGDQVSLNPLETLAVSKGDSVSKGQILGTVNDEGDPSSALSHFHLSLRVAGVYRDPTFLLFENSIISGSAALPQGANPAGANATPLNLVPENAASPAPSLVGQQVFSTQGAVQEKPAPQVLNSPTVVDLGERSPVDNVKRQKAPLSVSELEKVGVPAAAARAEVSGDSADRINKRQHRLSELMRIADDSRHSQFWPSRGLVAAALASTPSSVLNISGSKGVMGELKTSLFALKPLQLSGLMVIGTGVLWCMGLGLVKLVQMSGLQAYFLQLRQLVEELVVRTQKEGS
ncbi:MAG: M23 family metallopeptidase [Coriobacteriia bacterium]|nr:M23 family metallopeptidase [Coriobacteriia bacterium]